MTPRPSRWAAGALLALAACGPEALPPPPAGFDHAAITRDCGPADGAAVAIYLAPAPVDTTDPAPPYVRLYVWHGLGDLEGITWPLAGVDAEGSALYCGGDGTCEAAVGGSVTVNAVSSDSSIQATTNLAFPSAGRVVGGIEARWIPRLVFCG